MRLATLAFVLLLAASASAQTAPLPGSCTHGTAQARLDIGDVRAEVFNTGSLFYGNQVDGTVGNRGYLVPKATGNAPIYVLSLWLAGTVGGEVRAAATTYGPEFNFWPGPLGDDARPVDPDDCSPYDRIYTVSRPDLYAYARTGIATDDLRDWPWRLGAPVLDGDGDPDNYDLAAGDEPALLGDQTAWWLMNDVGGPHDRIDSEPLGVEVRVEAGAFAFGALRRFNQASVYRYTFTNRTAVAIDSLYTGLYFESSIGDFMGADTTRDMGFVYGFYRPDDQYGVSPAQGYQILQGPVGLPNNRDDDRDGLADETGERLGLTASTTAIFNGSGGNPYSDPGTSLEYLRRMKGLWNDGTTVRERGDGYDEQGNVPVTTFGYPGDPVTDKVWSEVNNGTSSPVNDPRSRRSFVATGPFRLGPGESQSVTFALPFAQGTSNLDSVVRLREIADQLRIARDIGLLDATRTNPIPQEPAIDVVRLGAPAPNPFRSRTVLRFEAPVGTRLRATLHDVLGRRLAVLIDGPTEAPRGEITVDGSGLAPGVYRIRMTAEGGGERIVTVVRTR